MTNKIINNNFSPKINAGKALIQIRARQWLKQNGGERANAANLLRSMNVSYVDKGKRLQELCLNERSIVPVYSAIVESKRDEVVVPNNERALTQRNLVNILKGTAEKDKKEIPSDWDVKTGLTYGQAKQFLNWKLDHDISVRWVELTAKNCILVALDRTDGFKEARESGNIKTMTDLYRYNVIGYPGGQISYFSDAGLKGLMAKKRPFFQKIYSPASLLKFALPQMIDLTNKDALDPLDVERDYWTDPENALYHIYQCLDKLEGFKQAREASNIAVMANIIREKVIGYKNEGTGKRGSYIFFSEAGGLKGLMGNPRPFLEKLSGAGLLKFAFPGLIDDNNPDALSTHEIQRKLSSDKPDI